MVIGLRRDSRFASPLRLRIVTATCIVVGLCGSSADTAEPVSFRSAIAPILLDNCVACHDAKKAEGGYRLDTFEDLIKAGDSEQHPIAGRADQPGELLRRLTTTDESERMPAERESLSAQQIDLVSRWLAEGARFDGEDANQKLAFLIPPARHVDPPDSYSKPVPITAVAFALDGQQVLVGGYHEVTVWDVSAATLARRIKNIGQRVFSIAFSSDGATLAIACGEPGRSGEVRLIDFSSGKVKGVTARSTDVILDVAFRPGDGQLAAASADNLIRIVDTETLTEIHALASHADWVTAVAWSDDGSRLASASRDKSAKVFDADSGQLLVSYQGHAAAVRGVAFLPDAKQVMSTGDDGKLHRWNVANAKKTAEVALGGPGYKLIRGDGFVLVPSTEKLVLKIDLSRNTIVQEFTGHTDWVLSAAFHAADSRLVSGAFNGELRSWNVADGTLLRRWLAKP